MVGGAHSAKVEHASWRSVHVGQKKGPAHGRAFLLSRRRLTLLSLSKNVGDLRVAVRNSPASPVACVGTSGVPSYISWLAAWKAVFNASMPDLHPSTSCAPCAFLRFSRASLIGAILSSGILSPNSLSCFSFGTPAHRPGSARRHALWLRRPRLRWLRRPSCVRFRPR